jgi:hypothetical protein
VSLFQKFAGRPKEPYKNLKKQFPYGMIPK